jgi:pimeloyl-ACP methyl ester carboxylesterase
MVHGYGASGLFFYRVIKYLVDAGLHLILIDIIGMGASGRPEFNEDMTVTEADEFFVDFLEKWRLAFGDIKGFYLAGHSFGGYICGQYALRYNQNIKKLILLSPAGVMIKPKDFDAEKIRRRGMFFKIVTKAWEKKWSPFGIMRKTGSWMGRWFIKKYLTRRMNLSIQDDEERQVLLDYMQQIFMREGSTEYAIFICFQLGLYAHHPLEAPERLAN